MTTALLVTSASILAYLMAESGRPVGEWIVVYMLAILSIALLFTLLVDRVLTTPVRQLAGEAARMARGDYGNPIAHASQDEIGELFAAIEFLRLSFLGQKQALEELNRSLDAKVDARTAELRKAVADLETAQQALVRTERLASIGGLAGGVAHEINNPTGVILTRADYLLRIAAEEKLSAEVIEDLTAIRKQAERIARITGALLSFSRQQPGPKRAVRVDEIVGEALALVEPSLKDGAIKVVKEIDPGVPAIHGDKGRLEQVLVNLFKNACDAMGQGGTLTVRAAHAGGVVSLGVRDTGSGIPPEVQAKIFEPFFTTKEVGKGTGLGLSIAYGIVAEHGGELRLSSAPGEGTEFTLVLPAHQDTREVAAR